ncbi:MAG: UvrB/UvrC motif-containing protein, partial [Candidatus Rifleibacteriota bacterium]
ILDADKEGFLRSSWSLMQTCGRAARNSAGEVFLYADKISPAMKYCIDETARRREIQHQYNLAHGIEPKTICKQLPALFLPGGADRPEKPRDFTSERLLELINQLKSEMEQAAARMEFEKAAMIRDEIIAMQEEHLELGVLTQLGQALKSGREKGVAKKRAMRNPGASTGGKSRKRG